MRKIYVLKNRIKFISFLSLVTLLLITMFLVTNVSGYKESTYFEIKVREGDTLWEIAHQNKKKGDIRDYINEIKSINNLDSNTIYPGVVLKLPYYH